MESEKETNNKEAKRHKVMEQRSFNLVRMGYTASAAAILQLPLPHFFPCNVELYTHFSLHLPNKNRLEPLKMKAKGHSSEMVLPYMPPHSYRPILKQRKEIWALPHFWLYHQEHNRFQMLEIGSKKNVFLSSKIIHVHSLIKSYGGSSITSYSKFLRRNIRNYNSAT